MIYICASARLRDSWPISRACSFVLTHTRVEVDFVEVAESQWGVRNKVAAHLCRSAYNTVVSTTHEEIYAT